MNTCSIVEIILKSPKFGQFSPKIIPQMSDSSKVVTSWKTGRIEGMNRPIALLTDFGLSDAYVGIMKGVMLSICPTARLIDITHDIAPQNVRQAAYVLMTTYRYFPPNTVLYFRSDQYLAYSGSKV